MQTVTLYIKTPDGQQTLALGNEISIGRTSLAQLVLSDASLSRLHATIFREGEDVWILDENSSNGSFVNGERIAPERKLKDGDEILLGSHTRIYVEIIENRESKAASQNPQVEKAPASEPPLIVTDNKSPSPLAQQKTPFPVVPILAGAGGLFIIIFAIAAIFLVRSLDKKPPKTVTKAMPPIRASAVIPIRVIDPLGGEDPDDLDDLVSSWEVEEKELNASDIEEIKTVSGTSKQSSDLKVSVQFWQAQRDKALNHAAQSGGNSVALISPLELAGGGVTKQKAKLSEMITRAGYQQPMDFADLAQKRLSGELVELPMATESYVLEVGGSASTGEFTSFDIDKGSVVLTPDSPKYKILQQLAGNFDGQKYDLSNPRDRKQMRIRLLRMYNPKSRKIFEEICLAYYQKFRVPLRITSLTRSMEDQIELNKGNPNSFNVKRSGTLAPHTSGCAFDMSRKNLSAEEQNFMMMKLADMERARRLDSLKEGSANACFHTFIYSDGIEPKA